ncbi:MAG: malonic semialdehyde reductase [Alphaproteobacteria bacterium]
MLHDQAYDILFRDARSYPRWTDRPVDEGTLRSIYDIAKLGPTSANCSPMRLVFVRTPEGKEKLKPCLLSGNVEKTMTASVCAIIAYDLDFHEHLPRLFPFADARAWFTGNAELIRNTAFRNGTLQAAYLMTVARGHGLDVGPMSGFDNAKVDAAFFAGTSFRSNFLCLLGHADHSGMDARAPRFDFDEVCRFA